MKPDAILDGIRDVARNHLGFQGNLTLESELTQALELDSLRLLTLVVEVENHFQVCLEEGDEHDLVTVGQLVDLLGRRIESDAR
jgi:acyl carrier protein